MSTSNEWINFISAIKKSTRIFLTISIRLLVFCGVSKEVAGWITRCRLNKKIKDRLTLSQCLLRRRKKDTESLGSWTYLLELLEEDKRQKSVQNSSWKDISAVKTNNIFFITFESFTNSMLSKLRFSSLRKFKLCISEKSYLFGAANVKSQKGMILAGELQFYQFPIGISLPIPCCKRGNTTKPEMGATSIWHPPCSGESITNWRCNTHPSILLGQTGILRSLHWRYFL